MKNLRSALFILALVSLICVFIPSVALAQDGGDDPCCHHAPSITASATQIANVAIDIQVDRTEMPALSQSVLAVTGKSTEMPIAIKESWTPSYRR